MELKRAVHTLSILLLTDILMMPRTDQKVMKN